MAKPKTRQFQTETKKLLQLMIHSLYSNKEIFLRELISNASDALDKLRFESLQNKKIKYDDLSIKIIVDKENKCIIVRDNGIGMSESELIENIGTIAKSGTSSFLEKLTGNKKRIHNSLVNLELAFIHHLWWLIKLKYSQNQL